uniref:Uncharacterized protein n=1 Tax=Trypanosoma congolense (strain IL3000) TaxID=1068625 RepID=G0UR83_TRYCI|nr:hypothetical protein, unlikely [Trypanosoma congolense IL3000]
MHEKSRFPFCHEGEKRASVRRFGVKKRKPKGNDKCCKFVGPPSSFCFTRISFPLLFRFLSPLRSKRYIFYCIFSPSVLQNMREKQTIKQKTSSNTHSAGER